MHRLRIKYIAVSKAFRQTRGSQESVLTLYRFKKRLERLGTAEAKEVLVDVYDLLNLKKKAFTLLLEIGDRTDPKTLKKMGILQKSSLEWGDSYAIPCPKTKREIAKEQEDLKKLNIPFFRYHPNPIQTGAFILSDHPVICDCCGKEIKVYYEGPFYAEDDIEYLCPQCIASGKAAKELGGSYQDDCSVDDDVNDPEKLDELIHRTPGFYGWQQERWLTHCGDYCAYQGRVGAAELHALGVMDEVLNNPRWTDEDKDLIENSVNGGSMQCYLFQCLHCGKHKLYFDFD